MIGAEREGRGEPAQFGSKRRSSPAVRAGARRWKRLLGGVVRLVCRNVLGQTARDIGERQRAERSIRRGASTGERLTRWTRLRTRTFATALAVRIARQAAERKERPAQGLDDLGDRQKLRRHGQLITADWPAVPANDTALAEIREDARQELGWNPLALGDLGNRQRAISGACHPDERGRH